MKLKKLLITVLGLSATLVFALAFYGCSKNSSLIGPYYAEYGQLFILPSFDGQTTVKDSENSMVDISSGRFYVDQLGNYSIEVKKNGKTAKGEIVVITRDIPIISTSFDIKYGQVNTAVELPETKAFVNGKPVETKGIMKKGDKSVDISDGFVPEEIGEFTYTITAEAGDKSTTKVIPYYIENDRTFENKIASFDKPYGIRQIKKFYGISTSYSTDKKYGTEDGSAKVTISTAEAEHEAQFAYGNFHIKDWSAFPGVGMYVYNDNIAPVTMHFNWSNATVLMPQKWTQVYIPSDKFSDLVSFGIFTEFDIRSADGLCSEIAAPINGKGTFSLYLSGMYAKEKDYVEEGVISKKIENFIAAKTPDYALKAEIEQDYEALPEQLKNNVGNWNNFKDKCLEFIRAEEHEENVLIQTDRPYGIHQLKGHNAILSHSFGFYRDGDNGSAQIQVYGFFAQLDIVYPMVDNLAEVEYLEFYLYNANPKDYAVQVNYPQLHTETLPSGEWTRIRLDVSKVGSVREIELFVQIYTGNWSQGMEKDNAKFYMSSVKMLKTDIATGRQLYDFIENLKAEGKFGDEEVKATIRYYSLLSAEEQTIVTNYKPFVKEYYLSRDGVPTDKANRLTYFDSEYGLLQTEPYAMGCKLSYSTEKAYGDEKGSLKLTGTADSWFMYVRLTETEDINLAEYKYIEFYIYADFDAPAKIVENHGFLDGQPAVNLRAKEWTKVRFAIPLDGNVINVGMALGLQDGNHGVDSGAFNFYISAMYAVTDETTAEDVTSLITNARADGNITKEEYEAVQVLYEKLSVQEKEKVTNYKPFVKEYYLSRDGVPTDKANRLTYFDSEYGLLQTEPYAMGCKLSYSTEKAYGDEKGSLKLTGTADSWFMYVRLTETEDINLAEYKYIEFYIYADFDAPAKIVENHGFLDGQPAVNLRAKEWTKVRFAIPLDGNVINVGMALGLQDGNHGVDSGAFNFYISAMYAVTDETTAEDVTSLITNARADGNITKEEYIDKFGLKSREFEVRE